MNKEEILGIAQKTCGREPTATDQDFYAALDAYPATDKSQLLNKIEEKKKFFEKALSGTTDSRIYAEGVVACCRDMINLIKEGEE